MISPGDQPLRTFLADLADVTPTPGGGAVAGISLATAGAIGHMAIAFSARRSALREFAALHEESLEALDRVQERGLELATADARAFAQLNGLWKLAEDDPEREAGWDDAVAAAIAAPAAILSEAVDLTTRLTGLVPATSPMLRSDLAVAAITAESAARSAAWNVRINLPLVRSVEDAARERGRLEEHLHRCTALTREVEDACGRG